MDSDLNLGNKPRVNYSGVLDSMGKGYRYAVLAAFGWLSLCGAQSSSQQTVRASGAAKASPAAPAVAALPSSPSTSTASNFAAYPGYNPDPCYNAKDKDAADLCAQWRSAIAGEKAAHEARRATTWSIVATLLNALGLVAVGAALYLTIQSNRIARDTARRQLRAYVSVKVMGLEVTADSQGNLGLVFRTVARNGGETPAYDCNHYGTISAIPRNEAALRLSAPMPIDDPSSAGGSVIHAGEEFTSVMRNNAVLDSLAITALKAGEANLFAFGVTSYTDTFGCKQRTDYCYMLENDTFSETLDTSEKAPGDRIPIEWYVAAFHNAAT